MNSLSQIQEDYSLETGEPFADARCAGVISQGELLAFVGFTTLIIIMNELMKICVAFFLKFTFLHVNDSA